MLFFYLATLLQDMQFYILKCGRHENNFGNEEDCCPLQLRACRICRKPYNINAPTLLLKQNISWGGGEGTIVEGTNIYLSSCNNFHSFTLLFFEPA